MIEPLTHNAQAILLLTAPLVVGRGGTSRDLLSLSEYNILARLLRENQKQPADLLGLDAPAVIDDCAKVFDQSRLKALLGRGFLLSQAVERWNSRSIWVVSRADESYPRRWKAHLKENAPPVLYGCGDVHLLNQGGLAVVGSRHVDEELIGYTEHVGRLGAEAHRTIVSGGAKGIDRAAMHGALLAGGKVVGVIADSLERAALARDNRDPLMEGRLVLVSPYDPAAGFNVGHAMQRNKLIYALADAALVVTSDLEKGGTWAGAIEQLDRLRFVPVFVRNGSNAGKGNSALLNRGGKPWPNPQNGSEFDTAITQASDSIAGEPIQGMFSLDLSEPAIESQPENSSTPLETREVEAREEHVSNFVVEERLTPELEMLRTVREILRRELVEARTEEEVADLLGITKPQARLWLSSFVKEAVLEKVPPSKPIHYRTCKISNRLF